MNKRVMGYIRTSAAPQGIRSNSIEAQKHAIETYCSRLGYDLCGCFLETGLVGGDFHSRSSLNELVGLCTNPDSKIVAVVASDPTRISRSPIDLFRVLDTLRAHSVRLECVRDQ